MLFSFFNTVVFVIKEILHTVSIVACSTLTEMRIEKGKLVDGVLLVGIEAIVIHVYIYIYTLWGFRRKLQKY